MSKNEVSRQSLRFHEILEQIKELHDKKQHDYGANQDIFANFRLSELSGIPAWQGSVVRMGDKYARISNFINKGEFKFKEESIKDTLMDMAIYSLITMILFEEAEGTEMAGDRQSPPGIPVITVEGRKQFLSRFPPKIKPGGQTQSIDGVITVL